MNDAPTISVVIPTFNRSGSLDRVLTALDAQDPVPGGFEILVVDDGSTDDTAATVARHPAASYLAQANAGPAAARNRGWRAATADLIAFTDDDTAPARGWLVELVAAFQQDPPPDAVGGTVVAMQPGFLADFVQLEGQVHHRVDEEGHVRYLVTANAAWRRNALAALRGFDETFAIASGEDTDLSMRAREAGMALTIADGAEVAHDHRATLRNVLSTFRKHGRSREQVVAANPEMEWSRRRRALLGPGHWIGRYRTYRHGGCGRLRAAAYLGIRAMGLGAYAVGVMEASRLSRRADHARPPSQVPGT